MIPDKRFTIQNSLGSKYYSILDEDKDFHFPQLTEGEAKIYCNALNELNDENKNLKRQVKHQSLVLEEIFNTLDIVRENAQYSLDHYGLLSMKTHMPPSLIREYHRMDNELVNVLRGLDKVNLRIKKLEERKRDYED